MKFESLYNHDDSLDVDLHYCGYLESDVPLREGPTVRKAFLIHCVTEGSYYLRQDDKLWKAEEGQCFLIVPDKLYYYGSNTPSNSYFWFSFNGKCAEKYLDTMGISFDSPIMQLSKTAVSELRQKVYNLVKLSENGALHTEILSELYGIIALFSKESGKAHIAPKANDYVKRAIAYIEHNYGSYLTVNEIVSYLSLNRSYFSKIFKKHTGYSPQKYLMELRIKKATELIRTTELKFNEICKCVGIREEYYFWRLFKQHTGFSPTDYKRECRRY